MKNFFIATLMLATGFSTASAITVTTPLNNATVTSPFTLVANTTSCGSQTAASMGYSLDYGQTTIVPVSFSALVLSGEGQHTLHVKCWGTSGAAGVTDVDITVIPPATPPPSNITVASGIQSLGSWAWNDDPGTPGSASGTSAIVSSPSLSGKARQYSMNFANSGGEIYHTTFASDTVATHFIYDAEIWLNNASSVANIEMDMNQVIANGDTVIYGVQCDGYSGTWDYTVNAGTPANPVDKWEHSNIACPEPKTWTPNTWHHIQISYFRDSVGNVTYQSVVLDGELSEFVGATGNSAFALGWASTLLTNFQIDGLGAEGSATAYVDSLTISRW